MHGDLLNALGALLVACAVLASHPMSNAQFARLEDRLALGWDSMAAEQGCADLDTGACDFAQPQQTPPL